jgi:hypothetical protein
MTGMTALTDTGLDVKDSILDAIGNMSVLELGLADHRVDSGAEVPSHAARAPDPIADRPHHARQILRPDHDERDQSHHQQFG